MSEFNGTVGAFRELGVPFVEGDVVVNKFAGSHIIVGAHCSLQDFDNELNKKHIVKIFMTRENKGSRPVPKNVLVDYTVRSGKTYYSIPAGALMWGMGLGSGPFSSVIQTWTPSLVQCPNPAAKPAVTQDLTETPEEREAFERIHKEQQIAAMTSVILECSTHSASGIATRLFESGCSFGQAQGGY